MIGQLRGQLLHKKPNALLLDVQGVGYEVFIPLTSFYELPGEGNEVTLKIHTHVREDALTLFGFLSQREKDFFLKLISISGIGPKLAIAILSGSTSGRARQGHRFRQSGATDGDSRRRPQNRRTSGART